MHYSNKFNNNSGLSVIELTSALIITGIVAYGANKLYQGMSSASEKVELETSLIEASQVIRTRMNCEKTLNKANTSRKPCGFNLLAKNGDPIFGAGSYTSVNSGDACDGTDGADDPFARGFITYDNKFDFSVQNLRNDGTVVVWARPTSGYTGEPIKEVKGDGVFYSAPLMCDSSLVPKPICVYDQDYLGDPQTFPTVDPLMSPDKVHSSVWGQWGKPHIYVGWPSEGKDKHHSNTLRYQVSLRLSECTGRTDKISSSDPFHRSSGEYAKVTNAYGSDPQSSMTGVYGHGSSQVPTYDTHTLTLMCNILGYKNYVSSDCKEWDRRSPQYARCQLTSTNCSKAGAQFFKPKTTLSDLMDPNKPLSTLIGKHSDYCYKTWVSSLTCSGKYTDKDL